MDRMASAEAIEWTIDSAAAASLAAAAGFVAWATAAATTGIALGASGLAFAVGYWRLRALKAEERPFDLPSFDVAPLKLALEAHGDDGDELLLDDPLRVVDADTRVVQLFDRRGQAAPIGSATPITDASAADALHAALAEIRRSLR